MTAFRFEITDDEVATINAARDILDALAERASHPWTGMEPWLVFMLGRIAEQATHSEGELFAVLNVIQSSGGRSMTYEQLHRRQAADDDDEPDDDQRDGDKSDVEIYGAGSR